MFDLNRGRNDCLYLTKSTLHLNNAFKDCSSSYIIVSEGVSTSTTMSMSLFSLLSSLATEPKIPSLMIPNLSPNWDLKSDNLVMQSLNVTIMYLFLNGFGCKDTISFPNLQMFLGIIGKRQNEKPRPPHVSGRSSEYLPQIHDLFTLKHSKIFTRLFLVLNAKKRLFIWRLVAPISRSNDSCWDDRSTVGDTTVP